MTGVKIVGMVLAVSRGFGSKKILGARALTGGNGLEFPIKAGLFISL